ncbi:hypothetical protein OG893_15220 [Streptomyces sp. NBC_01696]|uniref:hypothetical protein n=1 Tax=Streptomyces sp. NBC_01696 TaxID=2975913 RepID=UPI002E2FC7A6|nr:hypothetical protein [Streptomyces sp. NBC_01696]
MSTSVLDKARALQNQARHIAEAQKDAAQQERVVRRIEEVRSALEKATGQVEVAALLKERTGQSVNLASLVSAYERFENKSRGGLPADRVFTEAQKALEACTKEFASAIRESWVVWARARVSEVSSVRFAALAPAERREAETLLQDMRRHAERKTVDGTVIRAFCTAYADVARLLEHAPSDVPAKLAQLIERIDAGGLTLRDLSTGDIALLREYDQDAWISVTRKAD